MESACTRARELAWLCQKSLVKAWHSFLGGWNEKEEKKNLNK